MAFLFPRYSTESGYEPTELVDIEPLMTQQPFENRGLAANFDLCDVVPTTPEISNDGSYPDEDVTVPEVKNEASAVLPESLTVEELREELKLRQERSGGTKKVLLRRLHRHLKGMRFQRLSSRAVKRKRPHTRKQPVKADFDKVEDFCLAWGKWRHVRDSNNDSVKRSRDQKRKKKVEQINACDSLEKENLALERYHWSLRGEISFLVKALTHPEQLTTPEQQRLYTALKEVSKEG